MAIPTAASQTVEELFADRPLVGRRTDIEQLEALLETPPALAVVRGATGTGKTSLLAGFSRRAASRGWRSVWAPPPGPETDKEELVSTLRPHVGLLKTPVQAPEGPRGDQLLGRAREKTEPTAGVSPTEDTLVAGLARHPTVLLIDDYRASQSVEKWLLDILVPELDSSGAPVVVVVAGETGDVRNVVRKARVIDAEPPTEAEVREHLRALGTLLDPPTSEAEVETLAVEAASRPHLVGPLMRALRYSRTDE